MLQLREMSCPVSENEVEAESVVKSQSIVDVYNHSTADHMGASIGIFSPKCSFCIKMFDDMMVAAETERLEKKTLPDHEHEFVKRSVDPLGISTMWECVLCGQEVLTVNDLKDDDDDDTETEQEVVSNS